MNIVARTDKLVAMFAYVGGTIQGRKKLHKLIYLLQEMGEDFDQDYTFHNFGVFSPSLANDLDNGVSHHVFSEVEGIDGPGYTIRLEEKFLKHPEGFASLLQENSKKLLNELAEKQPQLLEALSTIVYLSQSYYQGKALKAKLKQLKPNLSKHYSKAFELASEYFNINV